MRISDWSSDVCSSDLKVSVDCALGCAIQPTIDVDIADQIRHAQIALKRAKQTDRIEIYEPDAAMLSDNRFGLETELRGAIEEDRLHLAFQRSEAHKSELQPLMRTSYAVFCLQKKKYQ